MPDSPFVERVGRVDAIAMELRLALDPSVDPEFCARMEQLYLFVEAHAQEALEARSAEPLQAARKVLATLLETWSEVELEGSPGSEGARDAA